MSLNEKDKLVIPPAFLLNYEIVVTIARLVSEFHQIQTSIIMFCMLFIS